MATIIDLQSSQLAELRLICDLGVDPLQGVVERLRIQDPPLLRHDELLGVVADALGERRDSAEQVVRQALWLSGWIRPGGKSAKEVIDGIGTGIEREPTSTPGDVQKWRSIATVLEDLLSLSAIRLAAAAMDLSYEHAKILRGVRVLTDIRPIYSHDATAIDGAVVSHTLRLWIGSMDGRHEVTVAVDDADIKELARQCERAVRKSETASDLMRKRAQVPTIISGESDNA